MNTETLEHARIVMQALNTFDKKMQLSTALTILEIAKAERDGEDLHVQDVEQRTGQLSGTASRNVFFWSDGFKDEPGHEMVSVSIDPNDRRRRLLKLTDKGREFVSGLAA